MEEKSLLFFAALLQERSLKVYVIKDTGFYEVENSHKMKRLIQEFEREICMANHIPCSRGF